MAVKLLLCVALFWILRPTNSQRLGLNNCLLSREDVVPCEFPPKATTRRPAVNEHGIYVTRFITGSAGFPICRILKRGHDVRPIKRIGITNQVFVLYSPGFTLDPPEKYGDSQYVIYNVACDEGRLAFFNVTKIDMETRTCMDPSRNNEMRCVDYILLDRGQFGVTESCGNDTTGNSNQLEGGNVKIIFRTNGEGQFPGFEANIICFDPDQRDMEGCTRPEGMNTTSEEESIQMRRRKRDLENFHKQWQRRAEYIQRMRRQAGGRLTNRFRFEEIMVAHGMNVTYRDEKLEFIDASSNLTLSDMTVENIRLLTTFDVEGSTDVFRKRAVVGDRTIPLPGPGPLYIVGNYAYFQLFVIDPRGLIPSPEEMVVLANLTEAQLEFAREDESDRLPREFLDQPTVSADEIGLPPFSFDISKRQAPTEKSPNTFDNAAVVIALENENACNPPLRASSNSIVEQLQMNGEFDRLDALRAAVATTEAVPEPNSTIEPE